MKFYKVILKSFRKKIIQIILFFILSIINAYLLTSIPVVIGYALNYLLKQKNSNMILDYFTYFTDDTVSFLICICMILFVIKIVICLFELLKNIMKDIVIQYFQYELKHQLFYHIQELTYDNFYHSSIPDLVQKASTDVNRIIAFLNQQLVFIVDLTLIIFFAGVQLFHVHIIFMILICIIAIVIISLSIWFYRNSVVYIKSVIANSNDIYQNLEDTYKNMKFIKLNGLESIRNREFQQLTEKRCKLNRQKYSFTNKYFCYISFISFIQQPFIFIIGGILLYLNQLSLGSIVIVLDYSSKIINSFTLVSDLLADFNGFIIAYHRLEKLMSLQIENEGKKEQSLNGYAISFQHANIYVGNNALLRDINFNILENERVMIVGGTGTGKSILFKTLIGFYPYDGRITLGNCEIANMNKKQIRNQIYMILQDSYIYTKTIADNIRILNPYYPQNSMIDLSKQFMLHDDIMRLKYGYDTLLGGDGIHLSKGQNQRLILTRSFIKPRNVMIFDDAFSAIDNRNKRSILHHILGKKQNFTLIMISYDITLAPIFDKIIFIDQNKVICDSHDKLLKTNKNYKKIWDIGNDIVGDKYE